MLSLPGHPKVLEWPTPTSHLDQRFPPQLLPIFLFSGPGGGQEGAYGLHCSPVRIQPSPESRAVFDSPYLSTFRQSRQ